MTLEWNLARPHRRWPKSACAAFAAGTLLGAASAASPLPRRLVRFDTTKRQCYTPLWPKPARAGFVAVVLASGGRPLSPRRGFTPWHTHINRHHAPIHTVRSSGR